MVPSRAYCICPYCPCFAQKYVIVKFVIGKQEFKKWTKYLFHNLQNPSKLQIYFIIFYYQSVCQVTSTQPELLQRIKEYKVKFTLKNPPPLNPPILGLKGILRMMSPILVKGYFIFYTFGLK